MKNAGELLRDQRIRFAFLHMPIPHPPGIYDRTTHQLSSHGDYLDNLVLADETLGALMKICVLRSKASRPRSLFLPITPGVLPVETGSLGRTKKSAPRMAANSTIVPC